MSVPKQNPNSMFRRISFVEGLSKERFYQIGRPILSENAHVYSIDDTSTHMGKEGCEVYIRRFTISLINKDGEVWDFYTFEKGSKDSVVYVKNGEFINL